MTETPSWQPDPAAPLPASIPTRPAGTRPSRDPALVRHAAWVVIHRTPQVRTLPLPAVTLVQNEVSGA